MGTEGKVNRYGDPRRGPKLHMRGKRAKLPPRMNGWVLDPAEAAQVPEPPREPSAQEKVWRPHLDRILLLQPGEAYELELPVVCGRLTGDPRKLAEKVRQVLLRYGVRDAMPYRLQVRPTARRTVIVKCLGLPD